ncbi:hypothetical protein N7490_005194 [Penicillium lividum]|nr:hypothetical protein N7490_005194 [Penicillium lividum]
MSLSIKMTKPSSQHVPAIGLQKTWKGQSKNTVKVFTSDFDNNTSCNDTSDCAIEDECPGRRNSVTESDEDDTAYFRRRLPKANPTLQKSLLTPLLQFDDGSKEDNVHSAFEIRRSIVTKECRGFGKEMLHERWANTSPFLRTSGASPYKPPFTAKHPPSKNTSCRLQSTVPPSLSKSDSPPTLP